MYSTKSCCQCYIYTFLSQVKTSTIYDSDAIRLCTCKFGSLIHQCNIFIFEYKERKE